MSVFQLASTLSQEHLASLIHKLRGPLSAISAQAELMAEGILGPLSTPQSEAVHSIRKELGHSLQQIEALEEIWIHDSEVHSAAIEPFDVCELFERVRHDFASRLENRQMTLRLDSTTPKTADFPSFARLQRLLQHLLTCQIALVPKGTSLDLHLSPVPSDASSIHQHGAVQTQLVRLEPLDLIVLMKAGEVLVQHNSEQLPTLGLRLPDQWSCWISIQSKEATETPNHADTSAAESSAPLILLADDQDALASVLGNYLQDLGYRVEKVSDGLEVVRLAQQLCPNLILMDLRMPLLSGLDALQQIRNAEDEAIRTIPVVCMSGFATAEEEARCLPAGASGFLRKPFRPADLHSILKLDV